MAYDIDYIELWKTKTEKNGSPFDFLLDVEITDFKKLNITDEEAKELAAKMCEVRDYILSYDWLNNKI